MEKTKSIALIGYRGTGKTTVAKRLAERLGYNWIDTDVEIERQLGKSIAAIFADEGEPAFRKAEAQVVEQLCARSACVLSLGGGAVLHELNQIHLGRCREVVWLKASVDTIVERLQADSTTAERRPNLTNHGGRNEIEKLLAERTPIYAACATLEVDTDGRQPAEIVDEILAAIDGRQ